MSAILLLSSRRQPAQRSGKSGSMRRVPANDEILPMVAPAGAPEAALAISFSGLSCDEQRKALASFPGGRRCLIAED